MIDLKMMNNEYKIKMFFLSGLLEVMEKIKYEEIWMQTMYFWAFKKYIIQPFSQFWSNQATVSFS